MQNRVASHVFPKFYDRPPPPTLLRGDGVYLEFEGGTRLLDTTAGWTGFAVLGHSHPDVLAAMREQMAQFCHADYNTFTNPRLEELAALVVSRAPAGLDRVYYAGNSGSEAIEAALKLSYQVHHDAGEPGRTWLIARERSFHGIGLHGLTVSDVPNLDFYKPLLPADRAHIAQHDPAAERRSGESLEEYAARGARELEEKILEIGPERVCAFIGETLLGSLAGDVPAAPGYWAAVREVCDRHGVHLILDEVYCGLGRTGRYFACDEEGMTPDFVCIGKNLAAGYAPLSAVVTRSSFEAVIARGQGRVQHGHTHQGHALAAAAALAVQRVVQRDETLRHIDALGRRMRAMLSDAIGGHPFVHDVRGRGLMLSIDIRCPRQGPFCDALREAMAEEHGVLLNAKWQRISFTPPYIISSDQLEYALEGFVDVFRRTAERWPAD